RRASAPERVVRRHPRRSARPARARSEAGRCAACLLLARNVRPAGDERAERGHVVARRDDADLLDAGLSVATADRRAGRGTAHRGRRVRLPARLVARRAVRRVCPLRAGRDLILVSNRGHIHGTGGFWRMTATPGAPMRELRYEETTWKARPDWSPDGRRVVYSSYLGRQWHQLWLMTSAGGDVVPLTYGEFDATAPRWSRDAKHIAYISNAGGNTALWVIDVPGAQRRQIVVSERRYRGPVGRLHLVVVDAVGRPLAARISVARLDGRAYAPDDSWRHADEAFDRQDGTNPGFEYGYFHTSGTADLTVPTGTVQVEVWHGPEYRVARADGTIPAGRTVTRRQVLE